MSPSVDLEGDVETQSLLKPLTPASPRYATVEHLSKYIPELNPEHERAKTWRVKMAKRTTMLMTQAVLSIAVVLAYAFTTRWAIMHHPPDAQGEGAFHYGNCGTVSIINSAVHVALNILSSIFLGAGNYCMQILVSPSREEIDRAHSKGKAMEIGVPSLKNLLRITPWRVGVWLVMGLAATCLHVLWNSSTFSSFPIIAVNRALVTNDFRTASDNWTAADPLSHADWWHAPTQNKMVYDVSTIYSLQDEAAHFTRVDTKSCLRNYINPIYPSSSLVMVARNVSAAQNNGSSLIDGWVTGWDSWEHSNDWICEAYQTTPKRTCNWEFSDTFADDWTLNWPFGVQVDYCLLGKSGDNFERCGLHYNKYILIIVCVCTALQSALIWCTLIIHLRKSLYRNDKWRSRAIVTMGDAVHSFLKDPVTNPDEVETPATRNEGTVDIIETKWRVSPNVRWFSAVGTLTWIISTIFFLISLAVPIYFLAAFINHLKSVNVDTSLREIWLLDFRGDPNKIVRSQGSRIDGDGAAALLKNILIVNSPQVLVSFLYLFYNNILTRQVVADEWTRFLRREDEDGKKTLRVSSPVGMQRSSYFLSLPLRFSIPKMIVFILLHWFVSQAIFLVRTHAFGPGPAGKRLPGFDSSARGYSTFGATVAIGLGIIVGLVVLVSSLVWRYKNTPEGFQRLAFNSIAIKAVCQRPNEDLDAPYFPIRIGILDLPGHARRLAFSTDIELQPPRPGERYLQPVFVQKNTVEHRLSAFIRGLVTRSYGAVRRPWNEGYKPKDS